MKVAIYARVSTQDQNVENQLLDLRRYCQARSWEIVKEFIDVGISGSTEKRPALSDCMQAARQRRADLVLVWRFDRFARSVRQLIDALSEFRGLGVDFVSYSEGIDTTTSHGRMVFGVLASIAEFERELIRERIRAGLRRARAVNKALGRPPVAVDLEKALQMRGEGVSLRELGRQLGVSAASLCRLFQNQVRNPANEPVGEGAAK